VANSVTVFSQTLVAAAAEASAVLVGTCELMDNVYLDYKPVETTPGVGQTVNIAIPATVTGSVSDGGSTDPAITDISFTTKSVVYNKHPVFSYIVRDFEQFNIPADIRNVFLDGVVKGMREYINNLVSALITTGNFSTNGAITGTGGSGKYPATADFLAGLANLAGQKCPMNDAVNLAFVNHPVVHYRILGDSNWTQQSIASEQVAERVRATGDLKVSYGFKILMDQQAPSTGSAPTRTFDGFAFHRHAIALVTRPLPKPDGNVVTYTYMNMGGIPVRVQFGYQQLKLGYVVTVDAGLGLAVIRPELGQIITAAE